MRSAVALFVLCCISLIGAAQSGTSIQAYEAVNLFIGTAGGGNTFPGATLPFGMIQWGPDTRDGGWYHYGDKSIRGLSLTHISGAGCSIFADVPILPLVGGELSTYRDASSPSPNSLSLPFSHEHEQADPGSYQVTFDNGVTADLTVTSRAGIGRFTFPAGSQPTLLFKAGASATATDAARKSDTSAIEIRGDDTIAGTVHSGGFCASNTNYVLYFVAKFSRPFSSRGVWDEALRPGVSSAQGHGVGAFVAFDSPNAPLVMKVGISFVSIANAAKNLRAEIPGWGFDGVRTAAQQTWRTKLSQVEAAGGTPNERVLFYTALYHMFLSPNLFSDDDGSYVGFDQKVRRLPAGQAQYANFSDWDIYRNVIQLHALLFPKQTSQEVQSLVRDAEQSGWLPRWPVANDVSFVMGGDSSPVVISSAYAFGARSFDTHTALRYMLKSATTAGEGPHGTPERRGSADYLKLGYVPLIENNVPRGADDNTYHQSSASVTLEYAAADFATSRLAAALGDRRDADRLLAQSESWRNLFDPETHFIRPRTLDGKFLSGFDPDHQLPRHTNWDVDDQLGFEEGSTWQYTWMIPQNYAALFHAMGGTSVVLPRLDSFFKTVTGWGAPTFTVVNEPDFCAPYTYLWLGYPWKTQEIVDRIRREAFANTPKGLPGNDDLGATSGVYVWSALGLYPEIPGVGAFAVGTPMFTNVRIRREDGATLDLASHGHGIYVHGVKMNGKPYNRAWIPLTALTSKHNQIDFALGAEPDHSWATQSRHLPPSFSFLPEGDEGSTLRVETQQLVPKSR
jgi:predicted alpha-1,2-mannosidase